MKIISVCGARPNFMKIAPLAHEFKKQADWENILVHTGQHYDQRMSRLFFDQLEIPKPDINLEVGSGSHAVQTAEVMKRFEEVCLAQKPTYVLVVGDVNSTIACALVAAKLGIRVIHVEAGLRSFDRAMPEEINRLLTDQISDLLFVSEESGVVNLRNEGISHDKIHLVGNVMIDTLLKHRDRANESTILCDLGLARNGSAATTFTGVSFSQPGGSFATIVPYAVVTLHRPSTVDQADVLRRVLNGIREAAADMAVVFPVHPRTMNRIHGFGLDRELGLNEHGAGNGCAIGQVNCIEPLGYLEFLKLMANAKLVVTDSGGIQEETAVLGIPCVTVRENTERPVTVTHGTNRLVGTSSARIVEGCRAALKTSGLPAPVIPLWDGSAAQRIVKILREQ